LELREFDPDGQLDNPVRWRVTVERMDGRRIDLLKLQRADPGDDGEAADG
jgi:hypothetical protein